MPADSSCTQLGARGLLIVAGVGGSPGRVDARRRPGSTQAAVAPVRRAGGSKPRSGGFAWYHPDGWARGRTGRWTPVSPSWPGVSTFGGSRGPGPATVVRMRLVSGRTEKDGGDRGPSPAD